MLCTICQKRKKVISSFLSESSMLCQICKTEKFVSRFISTVSWSRITMLCTTFIRGEEITSRFFCRISKAREKITSRLFCRLHRTRKKITSRFFCRVYKTRKKIILVFSWIRSSLMPCRKRKKWKKIIFSVRTKISMLCSFSKARKKIPKMFSLIFRERIIVFRKLCEERKKKRKKVISNCR